MTSEFGELLHQLRDRAGLTQEELADRSAVAVRTVRGLETGERTNPRADTVGRLAEALAKTLGLRPDTMRGLLAGVPAEALDLTPLERQILVIPADDAAEAPGQGPTRTGGPQTIGARMVLRGALAGAAEQLAQEVHKRWSHEAEQRRIHGPFLMPVHWQSAPGQLSGSQNNGSAPPMPPGELNEIADAYRQIKSVPRRLVVLGGAGSGKSALALRFTVDYIGQRSRGECVPVIFNLGSWDPKRTELRTWLIDQLLRDYPGLLARGPGGSTMAAELVEAGGILPVLDGFDEIAQGLYGEALDKLDATTLPMVLTSRTNEYAEAVRATGVLTGAAVVKLSPLTRVALADHLARTTRGNLWDPVLAQLRTRPNSSECSQLADALSTPLMLALARTVYNTASGQNPSRLLDIDEFPTKEALETHLLGGLVPAVYRNQHPERAQRWLGYLAWHADQTERHGRHDLAWWRLGDSLPRSSRVLAVILISTLTSALVDILISVPLLVPLAGAAVVRESLRNVMFDIPVVGLAFGLMYRLMVVSGRTAIEPSRMKLRLPGRLAKTPGKADIRKRFAAGLLCGLALGLGFGPTFTLQGEVFARFPDPPAYLIEKALTDAVLFGTAFGAAGGLAFALMAALETPLDLDSAATPLTLLAANRATVIRQILVGAPPVALVVAFGRLFTDMFRVLGQASWPWLLIAVNGAVIGLAGTTGYVLAFTAWGQWTVLARIWLPLTGKLPWSVPAFLDDAYHRGVLRQAGAVYQFRHDRLQQHLSRGYHTQHAGQPTRPERPAPPVQSGDRPTTSM